MIYLKIRNAGSLDRQFLYYIGGSKKRARIDDLYTIGNRGSGLKLATIGALKLGLKVIISSVDARGQYLMRPFTRPVTIDGHQYHQIIHEYWRESDSMALAGQLQETPYLLESFEDWDDPIGGDDKKIFKSLREFISNAYDEDKAFQLEYISPKSIAVAKSDETIVYLEATPELIDLLSPGKLYYYFKIFKGCPTPLHYQQDIGYIYPKSDPKMTRLFVRGVVAAVLENNINSSCFDYSLFDHQLLSEEKVIKSIDACRYQVGLMLQNITNPHLAATLIVEIALGRGEFENRSFFSDEFSIEPSTETKTAYLIAWTYLAKPRGILPVAEAELNHRAEQAGYEIKNWNISPSFKKFLQTCGVKTSADVVPLQGQMDFLPADPRELKQAELANYDKARELLYHYFPGAKSVPMRLVKPKNEKATKTPCGFAGELENNLKEICLNIKYFDSLEMVLTTMVHEYRHCASQATDYTRKFIDAADKQIVQLIFKNEIEHNRHVK